MRDYATVAPTFWIRGSGKQLRGDHLAQAVALYLMTCPSASMIGLYYLPIPTLAHEIGSPLEGAREALRRVEEAGIAFYDDETEMVWVPEMARYQIGEQLAPRDNRRAGVIRALQQVGKHRFTRGFHEKYRAAYSLPDMPELGFDEPEVSPFEAPSKPLPSPSEARNRNRDQEQDLSHTLSAGARVGGPVEPEALDPPASARRPRRLQTHDTQPAASQDEPSDPEAKRILEAIRDHKALASAATPALASAIGGRQMLRGTPTHVTLEAIDQCARTVESRAAVGEVWDVAQIADTIARYCEQAARKWAGRPVEQRRAERVGGLPPVQPPARPGQYDWSEAAEEARAEQMRELERLAAEMPAAVGGGG